MSLQDNLQQLQIFPIPIIHERITLYRVSSGNGLISLNCFTDKTRTPLCGCNKNSPFPYIIQSSSLMTEKLKFSHKVCFQCKKLRFSCKIFQNVIKFFWDGTMLGQSEIEILIVTYKGQVSAIKNALMKSLILV